MANPARRSPGDSFKLFVNNQDEDDLSRIGYCYQIGSTFVALNLMEDTIIDAMSMCDRIKVGKVLQEDAAKWSEIFMEKHTKLQSSTLGTLLTILSKHIAVEDVQYLRWLKEKRDIFVHRFFRGGGWPGELDSAACEVMVRRLGYLDIIFQRATDRIWKIFARAGLLVIEDFGSNGSLMMNPDIERLFQRSELRDERPDSPPA